MVYRNKKTGNVIDISCELGGEDWEEIKTPSKAPAKKAVKKNDASVRNGK